MSALTIRPEDPGEESEVAEVVRSAFQDELVVRLLASLRMSSGWRGLSFVAAFDHLPVAHLALTRGWLDAPAGLVEVLVLSPVSVKTEYQRQGIGSRLIRETLDRLAHRAEPLVFLEGNPAFYSRVGFKPAVPSGFVRPSVRIPERAFQYFALPAYESWMTGQLVYPDAFWELDCVGLRP